MAKPELGTKYTCEECGMKFYDLNREDFACPGCGSVPKGATSSESIVDRIQDEVIAGLAAGDTITEDAEESVIDPDTEDEDDDGVEEIDLGDEVAEQRLMEAAGTDDEPATINPDTDIDSGDDFDMGGLDTGTLSSDDESDTDDDE